MVRFHRWGRCPQCAEDTLYWDRTQEMYACHSESCRWTSKDKPPLVFAGFDERAHHPTPPGGSVRSDARKRREGEG